MTRTNWAAIALGLASVALGACVGDVVVGESTGGNGSGGANCSNGPHSAAATTGVVTVGVVTGVGVTVGGTTVVTGAGPSTVGATVGAGGAGCGASPVPPFSDYSATALASAGSGTMSENCVRVVADSEGQQFGSYCDPNGCECRINDVTACSCTFSSPQSCVGVTCCPAPWVGDGI